MTASSSLPTVFSGAQPTGQLTLGNYMGALRTWVRMQQDYSCIFCVVDLHALTVRQDPQQLRENIFELTALYLACGIDPERSIIFLQSHVPAHSELAWFLSTFTQMGELERMTQFKDKAQQHQQNINAALFTYPVLMAADILLYQTHKVPVGEDQKQHLELTRDVAIRFNGLYGPVFRVPEPLIGNDGVARVKDLQEPSKKMSKSALSELARVMLLDEPDAIVKKFKKAVTDTLGVIQYDEVNQPGVANLLNIWCAATGNSREQALSHFAHNQYGKLKMETAEAVNALLQPIRSRFLQLNSDRGQLQELLLRGAEQARAQARQTMDQVRSVLGLPKAFQ
ncbi:tryptophan--tRNA ligase [Candidatus Magnetaquicoccus inordinatus]|uniref:tryptophan--tRNA ligase n=1 Tax=Candidatus Magnetaquicoccus inordinatus TaxID=2496818 RepID=UPI00102C42C5|nr:tryptophan--tRNA ligase [Candidatus Magnetaquicoccus inordinatus]